jgi:hypothetical protein
MQPAAASSDADPLDFSLFIKQQHGASSSTSSFPQQCSGTLGQAGHQQALLC